MNDLVKYMRQMHGRPESRLLFDEKHVRVWAPSIQLYRQFMQNIGRSPGPFSFVAQFDDLIGVSGNVYLVVADEYGPITYTEPWHYWKVHPTLFRIQWIKVDIYGNKVEEGEA